MKNQSYINASEIGEFVFCSRSWSLARQKKPSLLETERERGVRFHQRHSDQVQAAPRARSLAYWWGAAVIVLLILWLLWALR
jgi:hypothetical protein